MTIVRQENELKYDQYYLNTVISISSVPCTIAIELFYIESFTPLSQLPGKPIKADTPLPIEAITRHIYFVRNNLQGWQLRKEIIFLDVKIPMDTKYQPQPACVTILNHLGDPIYFRRITPRTSITLYFPQQSMVSDKRLQGELDEEEALKINRYWRNKIIVGHNLKDKMEIL